MLQIKIKNLLYVTLVYVVMLVEYFIIRPVN